MEDRGKIVAWDVHPHRVGLIRENQRRLGINSIEACVRDAVGSIRESALYDRILVDVPCSGLGVLRRRADARWNRKPEDIRRLAEIQGQILSHALSLLAPGGKLLYSTCTTEPEENRQTVEKALAAYPECRKSPLALPYGKEENRSLLPDPARGWDAQFLPFIHGLEGFYMALIEKR
jgi:16S rRNA (cytosine967-C5)-methyltransferase